MALFTRPLHHVLRSCAGRWLLSLAWLAMASRAVVPTGYMPAGQGDDVHWLALCSGSGQVRVVALALSDDVGERSETSASPAMHCAFAAQAADQALPATLSGSALALATLAADWLPSSNHLLLRYLQRGPPLGARAPPLLV